MVGIHPLCLAFRAREGVVEGVVVWLKYIPSRVSSEECCGWKTPVLRLESNVRLTFEVARLISHRDCAQDRKYILRSTFLMRVKIVGSPYLYKYRNLEEP